MLAVLAKISYWCPSCDSLLSASYRLIPRVLTTLHSVIPETRQCRCGDIAKLVSIQCKAISDLFGDDANGYWQCQQPEHLRKYHPRPLKQAAEDRKFNSWSQEEWLPYEKIVGKGYPWKCPLCGVPMIYRDEREHKGTCQKQTNWISG
jgi:hypothetical protein